MHHFFRAFSRQTAQTDRRVEVDREAHVVAVVPREHAHQLAAQLGRLEARVELLQPQQVGHLQKPVGHPSLLHVQLLDEDSRRGGGVVFRQVDDAEKVPGQAIHTQQIPEEHGVDFNSGGRKLVDALELVHEALTEGILPLLVQHAEALSYVGVELIHPRLVVARLNQHVAHFNLRLSQLGQSDFLPFSQTQFQQFVRTLFEAERRRNHEVDLLSTSSRGLTVRRRFAVS